MIALRVLQREPSVPVLCRTDGFFVPTLGGRGVLGKYIAEKGGSRVADKTYPQLLSKY